MKLICTVILPQSSKESEVGFKPFKAIVEVAEQNFKEALVRIDEYRGNRIKISVNDVDFYPLDLTLSCNRAACTSVLLNIEICKFVYDQFPDITKIGNN